MAHRAVAVVDRGEENRLGVVQLPRETVHDGAGRHRAQNPVGSLTNVLVEIEHTGEEGSPPVGRTEENVAEVDPTDA